MVPVPSLTTPSIAVVSSAAVSALIGWLYWEGSRCLIDAAVGVDHAAPDLRLHQLAAGWRPRRRPRHLQRRRQQPLLADRDPGDVDRVAAGRAALPVVVDAALVDLVVGQVDRRGRVEAEAFPCTRTACPCRPAGRAGANQVLTELVSAVSRRDRAEVLCRSRSAAAVPSTSSDPGASIVVSGVIAPLSRPGRGGHHLEGRARRVEALGGAVEQRRFELVLVAAARVRRGPGSGRSGGLEAITLTRAGARLDRDDGAEARRPRGRRAPTRCASGRCW